MPSARFIAVTALVSLLIIATTGWVFQRLAHRWDRVAAPMPGVAMNVGEASLHIHCLGEGPPTFLFESGVLAFSGVWSHYQSRMADHGRACVYDRAGLGWSGPAPGDVSPKAAAARLSDLAAVAGLEAPFVLVAHSWGGYVAQAFAAREAERKASRIAALVLIDPMPPGDPAEFPPSGVSTITALTEGVERARLLNHFGAVRLSGLAWSLTEGLPEPVRIAARRFGGGDRHLAATARELRLWDRSARAADKIGRVAAPVLLIGLDKPLAAEDTETAARWLALQRRYASAERGFEFHALADANHASVLLEERHAASAEGAICGFLSRFSGEGADCGRARQGDEHGGRFH